MNEDRFIIGIGQGDHEYTVNGVKYIVNPVFRPFDFKNFKDTLAEAVEKYLKNDLAEWTNDENGSIMSTECVSTAGNGGRSEPEKRSNRTSSCSDPQFAKANCPTKGGKI